jgi:very-short-patch-repair endonuclease
MREGFMFPYNKNLVELAKELRKNMTPSEKFLWKRIRKNSLGYMFFRQRPIGEYIVDFFCPKAFLVVEVDGERHLTIEAKRYDKLRDEYMQSLELRTIRFSNSDVLNNTDIVLANINKYISTTIH